MNKIKSNIEKREFYPVYLLYGEDDYMKKLYKNKLRNAIVDKADTMNCSVFNDETTDEDEIISIAQTMPFFSDYRVIVVENSGLFSKSSIIPDHFEQFPESTKIVFMEKDVDKRSRMYKLVKDKGYICEMKGLKTDDLLGFIAMTLSKENVKITPKTASYMLEKVGNDMNMITHECEKLISYIWDRDDKVVREEDIDEICSIQLENKIFEMIDDLAAGRRDNAVKKYMDLLSLREAPAKMLRLIQRHFNILLLINHGFKEGMSESQICQRVKIPSFALRKYKAQLNKYNEESLLRIINECVEYEEKFKTGNISEQIAVDILISTL